MKDSYDEIFSDVERILVVSAHPDDFEVMCGATIARLIADNKKVRLVVTTNGSKGVKDKEGISETDLSALRYKEQLEGAEVIGVQKEENFNLNIADGELENSLENIGKVVYHIREFKPDLIITHNPSEQIITFPGTNFGGVNHRDHRHTGIITLDGAYPYSRDNNFFIEQLKQGLTRHEVHKLMFSDSRSKPYSVKIKVDNFIEKKKQALEMHSSQINKDDIQSIIDILMKQEDGYYETFEYVQIR